MVGCHKGLQVCYFVILRDFCIINILHIWHLSALSLHIESTDFTIPFRERSTVGWLQFRPLPLSNSQLLAESKRGVGLMNLAMR